MEIMKLWCYTLNCELDLKSVVGYIFVICIYCSKTVSCDCVITTYVCVNLNIVLHWRYGTKLTVPQKKTVWSQPSKDSEGRRHVWHQWLAGCRTKICRVSNEWPVWSKCVL